VISIDYGIMARRYLLLILVIFGISLYRLLVPKGHPSSVPEVEVARLLREGDGESLLALGQPIPLSRASLYDLELIKGLSDRTAGRILERKGEILLQASLLPEGRKWEALTLVQGIGPKNGRRLSEFIALE
jgi:hypothetical protein